ncbi:MAG TPA: hypothetical protein DCS23_00700 [Candidatus Yonathbacteria bacterium]|nr:hypothetical protein [Candidatus Yonathbacteria bacterium]
MKIFTHRGWSAGNDENTLRAFKKSVTSGADGVEFDIRCGTDKKTVVCAHDQVLNDSALTLEEALKYLAPTNLELLIEFKEFSKEFYNDAIKLIRKYNVVDRTTIFGFPPEAELFPWDTRQDIKLGIIAPYPKCIKKYIEMYNPDIVLLGWGNKKERLKFRAVWSFLTLQKTFTKYSNIKFVIGVAYTTSDKKWLCRQHGLYGITADMPLV